MARKLAFRLALALLTSLTLGWTVAVPVTAAPGVSVLAGTPIRSVYVRAPRGGTGPGKPVQLLLALHGMGGSGPDFSKELLDQADRYGWLIVAPSIDYGDWTKPDLVAREDALLIRALADYLDQVPRQTGLRTRALVLVLGHSRGAQLAHRFAEFRPDRVLAVAALSAGTYTLPLSSGRPGGLSFPFGVKDLAQYGGRAFDSTRFGGIPFWLGVGGLDTNPSDVPRQWDAYEGTTRVQRAQAFEAAVHALGGRTVLKVFGNTKHEITSEMRLAACTFLAQATAPRPLERAPLPEAPVP